MSVSILDQYGNPMALTRRARAAGGEVVHRFDAAVTNRLNSEHWKNAQGQPMNADLSEDLPTLLARCSHEAQNNPHVKGVIGTFTTHMVGKEGPILQVRSENKKYNAALEAIWKRVWLDIDISGKSPGPEKLKQWIFALFTGGEFLEQIVSGDRRKALRDKTPSMRLYGISARRLATPSGETGNKAIVMGIERTKFEKPIRYWIEETNEELFSNGFSGVFRPVMAKNMVHYYDVPETGQARGIPWLTSCLAPIAQLRDYDQSVLDVAQMAAKFGVLLYAKNPDVDFVDQGDVTVEIERGMMQTLPPGYEMAEIKPEQPATNYVEYRREKIGEIGRPVDMPLMLVTLDASDHAYATARVDDRVTYRESIKKTQGSLERSVLNRLVIQVEHESQLMELLPLAPEKVSLGWIWPAAPQIDEQKTAIGERIRLTETGTTSMHIELASKGLDFDEVTQERQQEKETLEAAGLPVPWEPGEGENAVAPTTTAANQNRNTEVSNNAKQPAKAN